MLTKVVRSLALLFIMDYTVYTRALGAVTATFPRASLQAAVTKYLLDVTSNIATYLLSGEVGFGHLTHVKKNAYILSRHPALARASGNELEWVQGRTYKNLVQAHHVMLKSLQTGLHRAQGLAELCNAQPYKRLCQQLITLITRTLAEPRLLVSVICHKHFEPIVSP